MMMVPYLFTRMCSLPSAVLICSTAFWILDLSVASKVRLVWTV